MDLITETIEAVRRDGWATGDAPDIGTPEPLAADIIADLRLPGDRPLPPSLRRWLEFDAAWLADIGWYDDPAHPSFEGRSLSDTAMWLYDDDTWRAAFVEFESRLPGRCLPLVGGAESRRLLYLGDADSTGEYPILVTDVDDQPYIAVMYPGLDVYLAHLAGVLDLDFHTYTSLIKHPDYGSRMREHATLTGLGPEGIEL